MKLFSLLILVSFSLLLLACESTPQEDLENVTVIQESSDVDISEDQLSNNEEQTDFFTRGIEPDGSFFMATVSVTEASVPGTFQFTWSDNNVPVFTGVGIEFAEDIIAVGTEGPMVKLFRRTETGYQGIFYSGQSLGVEVLSAEYNEEDLPAPSTLFAVVPWPTDFIFEVSGTNPDETEYTGILQTRPLGDGAQVLWTQDDGPEISGGAIILDNRTIIAAYSVGIVVYKYIENNVWRGEWYSLNNTALGVEFITPLEIE